VPIRSPEKLLAARPDDVLILTWDIAREVAEQLAVVSKWGGRFIVPVPEPPSCWPAHVSAFRSRDDDSLFDLN